MVRLLFAIFFCSAFMAMICCPLQLSANNPIIVRKDVPIQNQINKPNSVYIIRDKIDINKSIIKIPENSILKFEGGSLENGTLVYDKTYIEGRYVIYCKCSGSIANDIVEPHMYGAMGDGKADDSYALQQSINSGKQILFRRCTYLVDTPLIIDGQNYIVDFNFATIKKKNKRGINDKYKETDLNQNPCVIFIKPYESNTSGHIVLKNLIIDGGNVNCGIHAIWCRNVIFENVRIYATTMGLVYKGFTNTFRDITVWSSHEGFVLLGGNATLFERCFSSKCGWRIENVKGISLVACSSDDFNPCYSIINSSVSMIGCTFESKGIGMVIKNSVVDLSGDFEAHIYDSTKELTYLIISEKSVVHAKGVSFHLGNYLNKKIPASNLFDVSDNSILEIDGEVLHGNNIMSKISSGSKVSINGNNLINGNNTIKK